MGFQLYITQPILQEYTMWYLVANRWLRDASPRSAEPRVWLTGAGEFRATAQTSRCVV